MLELDRWSDLRARLKLFGNVEPTVKLVGITTPTEIVCSPFMLPNNNEYSNKIEQLVPKSAQMSTNATIQDYYKLTKTLLKLGHLTPFEAVQFNFQIEGISKACSAQMSRHRVGTGHVSSSRRYQKQGPLFVYPPLNYVEDMNKVASVYTHISSCYESSYQDYYALVNNLGLKKGDSRFIVPVGSSSSRIMWINARALRHFFELRLHKTAEEEIRRLAYLILDVVMKITPALFEDIHETMVLASPTD